MSFSLDLREQDRLQRLHELKILDTPREAVFDDLVSLAAHVAGVPISTITLIDAHRQWFKSKIGLAVEETERSIAFCDHAIRGTEPLVVGDALRDARFAANPLVLHDPKLRFYVGIPLLMSDGVTVGTLTVMDVVTRELSEETYGQLKILARQVVSQLELRLYALRQEESIGMQDVELAHREAMRRSDARFRVLFASAAAGIALANLDGDYIQANPAYCATVGLDAEEVLRRNFFELTHPDDRPRCGELVSQLAAGEIDHFVVEKRYLRASGDVVWVWTSVSAISEDNDMPKYIIAVTTDITQHKLMAERLSESESLLRIAGRVANLGGWALDVTNRHVEWSDEVCALLEVPPGTLPSTEQAFHFFAPEWRAAIYAAFEACIENGVPFAQEAQIITAAERRRWVKVSGEGYRDANGRITRVHGAMQDIEEFKLNEAYQRELATRLVNTLESITDAFYTLDHEWRFTYLNGEAERLMSVSRAEVLGRSVWEVFSAAVNTPFYQKFQQAVRDNVTVAFEDYYPPLEKWFDVRIFPSKDGLSVYFHDVTERRNALQLLQVSEERFQIVARATRDAISDWDLVHGRVWWNESIEMLFGYSRARKRKIGWTFGIGTFTRMIARG